MIGLFFVNFLSTRLHPFRLRWYSAAFYSASSKNRNGCDSDLTTVSFLYSCSLHHEHNGKHDSYWSAFECFSGSLLLALLEDWLDHGVRRPRCSCRSGQARRGMGIAMNCLSNFRDFSGGWRIYLAAECKSFLWQHPQSLSYPVMRNACICYHMFNTGSDAPQDVCKVNAWTKILVLPDTQEVA